MPRTRVAEHWRPCLGGRYSVSTRGRVRNRLGRLRSPAVDKVPNKAYPRITVVIDGMTKCVSLHRLVAQAFIGERPPGMEINHKNGVKTDNRVGNLEYVTRSENAKHAIRLGLRKMPIRYGEKHGRSKLTDGDIRAIRASAGLSYQKDLAREFGVCRATISDILRRVTWRHIQNS